MILLIDYQISNVRRNREYHDTGHLQHNFAKGDCGFTINVNILLRQITSDKFIHTVQLNSLMENALSRALRVITYYTLQINCLLSEQEASISQSYLWRCFIHAQV
jgi:hypothetical protein